MPHPITACVFCMRSIFEVINFFHRHQQTNIRAWKTQRNAVNACGNEMCKCAFSKTSFVVSSQTHFSRRTKKPKCFYCKIPITFCSARSIWSNWSSTTLIRASFSPLQKTSLEWVELCRKKTYSKLAHTILDIPYQKNK